MWVLAAMIVVGAISGAMEGDAIKDQADREAKDLKKEGELNRRNAYGEARNVYVEEQLAGGQDSAMMSTNNISSGMSEYSGANQLLAANRQAALRESQEILEEGDRMNYLYRDRARTTQRVGKERAQKAIVNGIVGGAVSGASASKGSK